MNRASKPDQSSHAVHFNMAPSVSDGNLAPDVSGSDRTTTPHVNFVVSSPESVKSLDDGFMLQDHDTQAILKSQAAPFCQSLETEPNEASSQLIVVRYTPTEPNANPPSNSDRPRLDVEHTVIVCVKGSPCWNEIVTLIQNTVDCSDITLLPINMAAMQSNPASDADHSSSQVPAKAASQPRATRSNNLTPRESEVVQLYQSGMSAKRIAEMLGISIETLRTHRKNIFLKLGCRSIVQAVTKMTASKN